MSPPKKTIGDAAHTLVKSGVSAIPIVGGPAAELFAAIVQPPIERRRDQWMNTVGEVLQSLQSNGFDLSQLQENPEFIDTVLQATQIALRSHQEAKRQALANAITSTALGRVTDDMLRQIFLRYIDELTPEHLSILVLFDGPTAWFARANQAFPNLSMGGLSHVLEEAFSSLERQPVDL